MDEEIRQKQILIELKWRKRVSRRGTTKARHDLEKLIVASAVSDIQVLEHQIGTLWDTLEDTQCIIDELSAYFVGQKDFESQAYNARI